MYKRKFFIAALMALLFWGNAFAQTHTASEWKQYVKAITDSAYAKSKPPGILVMYQNKAAAGFYSAGYAIPDSQTAFTPNTFFEIGSITKTFTAYILLCVLKQKGIADTSFILPYLPDSVQANEALKKIQFVHLLNHTSGLPRLPGNMNIKNNPLQPYQHYDAALFFAYLKKVKPVAKPKYLYSNLGAALAGVLAQSISGKSYAALLDEIIFYPFGIAEKNQTALDKKPRAQGYINDSTKVDFWNMNIMAPAGGLICNANEMSIYLSQMSKPRNKKQAAIINRLTGPGITIGGSMGIGLGWHYVTHTNQPTIYWHNGGTYGYSSFAAFIKDTGQWVLVIVNRFDANDTVSDVLGMRIINKMIQ